MKSIKDASDNPNYGSDEMSLYFLSKCNQQITSKKIHKHGNKLLVTNYIICQSLL